MGHLRLPRTALLSVLAALTTWLTMSTWSTFSEAPSTYLGPLALGCALVAVSGAVLRTLRLHPAVVLLGQLALVVLWLNHGYAAEESVLGWLPTPDSVRAVLGDLAASADAAKSYAAPVPESVTAFPPVLVVVGTFCAVLVDFLACGLRRVPLAGLPLLATYTAPVSVLDGGVPWWKFALVALCFLSLLAADEATRLAHWGRDLGIAPGSTGGRWAGAPNRTVWPSARKIGFTATAMAVALPVLVPTFSGGLLAGSGPGDGSGGNGVRITNPMLTLKRDLERGADVPQVFLTTSDPRPAYLRVAVLDVFDGNAWRPGRRDIGIEQRLNGELPRPEGLDSAVRATRRDYRISADESFESIWLPVPYPYAQVEVPGDWRYDRSTMDVLSAVKGDDTGGLTYDVAALDIEPTAEQLESAGAIPSELFRRYTEVDRTVPDEIGQLAQRVTAAGTNRAERAALLQDWFSKPHADEEQDPSFTYSLARASDDNSIEALVDFLQNSRTGYCQQFAGAMALMARMLSIPARVAVGFLRPERTGPDTWLYSTHDLHAWPELYFDGVGWVIFEPTPSSRQGAASPPYTGGLRPTAQPTQAPTTAAPSARPSASARPTNRPLPQEPAPVGELESAGTGRYLYALMAVVVLMVLGTLPRAARSAVRRRRWATARDAVDQAEAAWAELRDSMLDLRLPWNDSVTVRQRAREIGPLLCRRPGPGEEHRARVIRDNPAAQAALDRIVGLLERARYARTVPSVADVRADVALCVEALRIGVDRGTRRKADWLPASLTRRSRHRAHTDSGLDLSEPSLTR